MTVATVTLGCKVNQVDSEALRARLLGAGFVDAAPEKADVVVVNSCAVTAESERKTRQKLRQCRALNPDCILVLTGCAAQVSANAAEEYPEADIVLGHIDSGDLARYIDKFMSSQGKSINVSAHYIGEPFAESAFFRESARTRASIKIEDGCDRFCSYCIIPRARGHVRSKPLAAVRQEAETLAQQGFREVVLVGINLAAYGTDIGCDLADAVALMDECSGIQRVRLGSLEPDLLTDKLFEAISRSKSLCNHFHVSLQSGSDSVLNRMNRHYTAEEYFRTLKRLRSCFPDCAITTDIMIGFPGESDEAFEESIDFVRQCEFAKLHVFPYSARPGTAAAGFAEQIDKSKKRERMRRMLSLAEEMNRLFLLRQCGKLTRVLLEEPCPMGGMQGYAPNYARIAVPEAGQELRGEIIDVRVRAVKGDYCTGELAH